MRYALIDHDDLVWAREDLGPEASEDEVLWLAEERAMVRIRTRWGFDQPI